MKDYILNLDRPRELRFGFKSFRTIKEKFGIKKLEELMHIDVDQVPILIHAGLKWDDKELTLEQVEDLLDATIPKNYTVGNIMALTLEAFVAQLGVKIKIPVGVDIKKASASEPEEKAEKKSPIKKIPSTKKRKKQP